MLRFNDYNGNFSQCCICLESNRVDLIAHTDGGTEHPIHRVCMQLWADRYHEMETPSCPTCRKLIDRTSLLLPIGPRNNSFLTNVKINIVMAKAWFHYSRNNLDRSMENLNRAYQIDPTNITVLAKRGLVHLLQGNLDRALIDCNRASRINPNDFEVVLRRGEVHYRLNNWDLALSDLNRILQTEPNNRFALSMRRNIHSRQSSEHERNER